ncbi:MAG TPA: ATP synthase F1 subunit delta [Candidatus Acidoferrales bacterium]|nr:ATP synthase F1 subunit delta [Candidatus Acidoferrales bacterium]
MSLQTISRRYAVAIFDLAEEAGKIDETGADLRTIRDAVGNDPEVRRFFLSPVVDRRGKESLLRNSLHDRVGSLALDALSVLIRKRREALLAPIADEYHKLQLAQQQREPLTIRSAHPLDRGELDAIVGRLGDVYGKQFEVSTSVEPALLGGVQIQAGDRYIDGSVAGRLEELARELYAKQQA